MQLGEFASIGAEIHEVQLFVGRLGVAAESDAMAVDDGEVHPGIDVQAFGRPEPEIESPLVSIFDG